MRPELDRVPASWRDATGVGLLVLLALVLLGAWQVDTYPTDVAAQLLAFQLLAALGFLLVLRRGGVDWSVWAVMGLGGVVAARLLERGLSPEAAFAVAIGAGAVVGGVNALLARLKVPTVLGTLATAVGVLLLSRALAGGAGQILVPEEAFAGWWPAVDDADGMTVFMPMMVVLGGLVAVLLALMFSGMYARRHGDGSTGGLLEGRPHWQLTLALVTSGALAALAGAIWLLDSPSAPVPRQLVGDLRVLAAPLLAGALYLRGPGRTLLSAVLLPASMLVATVWWQRVWPLPWGGWDWQLLLLAVGVVTAQAAMVQMYGSVRRGRSEGLLKTALAIGAMLLLAATAYTDQPGPRTVMQYVAVGLWAVALAAVGATRAVEHRRSAL